MKRIALILILAAPTPALAQEDTSAGRPPAAFIWKPTSGLTAVVTSECSLAVISADKAVSVDWKCVDRFAANYEKDGRAQLYPALAVVLKAVRDGTAKESK
jgi:hypothetical protein